MDDVRQFEDKACIILNKVINCDFSFAVILNEVKNLTDVNRRFFATAQNDTITNCDLPQYNSEKKERP